MVSHWPNNYRPMKHRFQQIALCGDRLGGSAQRRVALGSDYQRFVSAESCGLEQKSCGAFFAIFLCIHPNILYLNATDVAVVRGVQGIRQAENCGEFDGSFLLVREKIAQESVPSVGEGSAVKAGDNGGAAKI